MQIISIHKIHNSYVSTVIKFLIDFYISWTKTKMHPYYSMDSKEMYLHLIEYHK